MAIGKLGFTGIGVLALVLLGCGIFAIAQPFDKDDKAPEIVETPEKEPSSQAPDHHQYDSTEIRGFHFHTYFFQDNARDTQLAKTLREQIIREVNSGNLADCVVGPMLDHPDTPHVIGQYVTCCKATGISRATSWFMKNRGNRSVLLHPLTKDQLVDHTERVMWLGASLPLDYDGLEPVLEEEDDCDW